METKDIINNWGIILSKYTIIKELYVECEETDPDLKTNLQPLNEFRAALDHIMKMQYAYIVDENHEEYQKQYDKLNSHLTRAFYDICDMLSINYRNKIIDILQTYSVETIRIALPEYYPDMRPKLEKISGRIVTYRTQKGNNNVDTIERFEEYKQDIETLRDIFGKITENQVALDEVSRSLAKEINKTNRINLVLGAILGVIGSAIVTAIAYWLTK